MKTAVSIPDSVFQAGEELSARLGVSRSRLYARAVDLLVKDYRRRGITEALDAVYASRPAALDPLLAKMQWVSLPPEDW